MSIKITMRFYFSSIICKDIKQAHSYIANGYVQNLHGQGFAISNKTICVSTLGPCNNTSKNLP